MRAGPTRGALSVDLRRAGIEPGTAVLVHSSLSSLGWVEGGADTVIDALLDTVGPRGSVLFPTLTGKPYDGPERPPYMDVLATPCWTGRIPMTARLRPGAIRSLHSTHSVVALGARAAEYAADHDRGASPCDRRSPYYRLVAENALILLLGVTQDSNTTLHCLEELAEVPYHLQERATDGVVIDTSRRRYLVRNRLHAAGRERDFGKCDPVLVATGAMRTSTVGRAEVRLIRAGRIVEVLLPILQNDPLYLLNEDALSDYRGELALLD